jgi:hypothetical protein
MKVNVQAIEALRRAKFKFAGRQKIIESNNWGFTQFNRDHYVQWKQQGRIVNCGVHAQARPLRVQALLAWICISAANAAC